MKHFLGRGFGFPFGVDAYGRIDIAEHEDSVKQAIHLILGTAVGERIMEPSFGCKIHDLVFHPNNPNTCAQVSVAVREALTKWEPRIRKIRVKSYPDPRDQNVVLINIEYEIRQENNIRNMVYPFYLRREQDL